MIELSEDNKSKLIEWKKEGRTIDWMSKKLGILDMFITKFFRDEAKKLPPSQAQYARYRVRIKIEVIEQLKQILGVYSDATAAKVCLMKFFSGEGLTKHEYLWKGESKMVTIKSNKQIVRDLDAYMKRSPVALKHAEAIKQIICRVYRDSAIIKDSNE